MAATHKTLPTDHRFRTCRPVRRHLRRARGHHSRSSSGLLPGGQLTITDVENYPERREVIQGAVADAEMEAQAVHVSTA